MDELKMFLETLEARRNYNQGEHEAHSDLGQDSRLTREQRKQHRQEAARAHAQMLEDMAMIRMLKRQMGQPVAA